MGATDRQKEGSFVWNYNGVDIDYEEYFELGSGEPENNDYNDCVEIEKNSGIWTIVNCQKRNHVLCERLLAKPTNVPSGGSVVTQDEQFCSYFDNQVEKIFSLTEENLHSDPGNIVENIDFNPDLSTYLPFT